MVTFCKRCNGASLALGLVAEKLSKD